MDGTGPRQKRRRSHLKSNRESPEPYRFSEPLREGVVVSRPNRFIMMVRAQGETFMGHCPTTGRLGEIVVSNVPCLFSESASPSRKTRGTVEAISLSRPGARAKSWIGINQTAANRYVEHFLKTGQLSRMATGEVRREVKLGASRIDFLVGDTYVEVKTPLIMLPTASGAPKAIHSRFDSFDRLIKHMGELSSVLQRGKRAAIVLCFQYDAAPFRRPSRDVYNAPIVDAAEDARRKGVETWQVNLGIDARGLKLLKYFRSG